MLITISKNPDWLLQIVFLSNQKSKSQRPFIYTFKQILTFKKLSKQLATTNLF